MKCSTYKIYIRTAQELENRGRKYMRAQRYLVPGIHVQAASNNVKHNKTRLPASLEELLKTSRIE
jgi:hypothetical protein